VYLIDTGDSRALVKRERFQNVNVEFYFLLSGQVRTRPPARKLPEAFTARDSLQTNARMPRSASAAAAAAAADADAGVVAVSTLSSAADLDALLAASALPLVVLLSRHCA